MQNGEIWWYLYCLVLYWANSSLVCAETSCVSSCTDQKAGSAAYLSSVYRDIYLSGGSKVPSQAAESFFVDDYKKLGGTSKEVLIGSKKFNILIEPSEIDALPKRQRFELTKELDKFSVEDFKSPKKFEFKVEGLKK